MTTEEIILLAWEAGFEDFFIEDFFTRDLALERLAHLIASAEREACARVCRDLGRGHDVAFAESDCVEAIRARWQE